MAESALLSGKLLLLLQKDKDFPSLNLSKFAYAGSKIFFAFLLLRKTMNSLDNLHFLLYRKANRHQNNLIFHAFTLNDIFYWPIMLP